MGTLSKHNMHDPRYLNEGEDAEEAYIVTPSGGTIKVGEIFTVIYPDGGLILMAPTSVVVNGVSSTEVTVVSDTRLTARAGVIVAGSGYTMTIT